MLIPVSLRPSGTQLRNFGLITAGLLALVAISIYWRGHFAGISLDAGRAFTAVHCATSEGKSRSLAAMSASRWAALHTASVS